MRGGSPVRLCVVTVAKSMISETDWELEPGAGIASAGKGSEVYSSNRENRMERIILLLEETSQRLRSRIEQMMGCGWHQSVSG